MSFMEDFGDALAWVVHYAQYPEVVLSQQEFDGLYEYSCSVPTGVTPGKRWKRNENANIPGAKQPGWLLGEYVVSPTQPDTHCSIRWSRIIVNYNPS